MQIEVIPGAHHSPGARCLDSAREALIEYCGQSSEVGELTVISCSTGPCKGGTRPRILLFVCTEKDEFAPH